MNHEKLASIVRAAINLVGDVERENGSDSPEVIGLVAAALVTAALKEEDGRRIQAALFPEIPRN